MLDIDVQGALKFYKFKPDSHFIAILPPTWETLRDRLEKRGTETPESLETRTKNALKEKTTIEQNKNEVFTINVVNDDLEAANHSMQNLIVALYEKELVELEV